jgi:hypothetical protein
MTTNKLAAYTCRFGSPIAAINYKNFEDSLIKLSENDKNLLKVAWIATIELSNGDCGKEIRVLRTVICKLRDTLRES